jgi:hypothetical protein
VRADRPPVEATVLTATALSFAVFWAVVSDAPPDDPATTVQVAATVRPPAPGLVPAPAPRRVIVVRRRSRAS